MNADRQTEANHNRRMANESRYITRRERLEAKCERLIGELCREGRTVYYANVAGGKVRESASWTELADFLIRNGYA